VFAATNVTTAITDFVSFEMGNLADGFVWFRFVAPVRRGTLVSMIGVQTVIDVAVEVRRTVEPWAGSDEDAPGKPLRTIVTVGCASIGGSVVIPVGAVGGNPDVNADLSRYLGSGRREADSGNSSQNKTLESVHLILLAIVRFASPGVTQDKNGSASS
jgi:hypothetical protein